MKEEPTTEGPENKLSSNDFHLRKRKIKHKLITKDMENFQRVSKTFSHGSHSQKTQEIFL